MLPTLLWTSASAVEAAVVKPLADTKEASAGYGVVDAAGTVATFGGAGFYGDLTTTSTSAIAIVATPDGEGYWLISASGSVSSYGDATFYGSAAGGSFSGSIVGMAATPSGKG